MKKTFLFYLAFFSVLTLCVAFLAPHSTFADVKKPAATMQGDPNTNVVDNTPSLQDNTASANSSNDSSSSSGPGCATSLANVTDFKCFVDFVRYLINQSVILIIGLAVLLFIIGLLKYILAAGDADQVKEARGYIIFGLIAIFIMFSVWGLVNLLHGFFFGGSTLTGPQFKQ